MADTPLQVASYNTNTAATSHTFDSSAPGWWPSDIQTPGGAILPSTIFATLSYDGTATDKASITDSNGRTWYKATKASDGSSVNGEIWYSHNYLGGGKPEVYIELTSSQKLSVEFAEFAGILWYADPKDTTSARIDSTNSTSRSTLAGGYRLEPYELVIGGVAWNNAGITTLSNTTSPVALRTLVAGYTQNGSSNLGAGIIYKDFTVAAAILELSVDTTANRVVCGIGGSARTTPVAVMHASFYRAGVATSAGTNTPTDEDGLADSLEGSLSVDTTFSFILMTSSSAPTGDTGGSEKTDAMFFPSAVLHGALPDGVTVTASQFVYAVVFSADDPGKTYALYAYVDKTDPNGAALDNGDYGRPTSVQYTVGAGTIPSAGKNTLTLTPSHVNLTGRTSIRMTLQADELNAVYLELGQVEYASNRYKAFILLTLNYPAAAIVRPRRLARLTNAPRLAVQRVRR